MTQRLRSQAVAILISFFLMACGTGGGDDGFSFLDQGGGNSGPCSKSTSKLINNDGGSVESEDKKARVDVPGGAISLGGAVEVSITVRCQISSFNGRAYDISFIGNAPTFSLVIAYENSEIPPGVTEANLGLGTLTTGPQGWDPVVNTNIGNNQASASGLNTPGVYGIFIENVGAGGSSPTPPQNVQAVARGPACLIDVTWNPSQDPDGDLSSYSIFRDNVSIGAIAANQAGCCIFTDSDRIPNRLVRGNHRYFIRANDAAGNVGESDFSNTVAAPASCPAN